nr:retrovirus-related Pol polyprotein from transposon TNT 1-94 [Tanacetum cinerariifolium]
MVLVTKTHNKTPYELLHGRSPSIGFMRPFGCPITILNTLDHLGKFQEKVDEGFLVEYFMCSKSFRNNVEDVAFDGKEHDFDVKKPESKVILSPSSSAQSKEQDDKTMKEAKGNNMPGLEDIIYSDDEDVVGAEADFNNLESSIPVILRYDRDECDKGRMPTKIELTLEQSQQGVSNDVLMEVLLEPSSNKLLVGLDDGVASSFQRSRILRLLTSFQDDAKYEYGGQDTRVQGGKDDQDEKDKDLKISNEKTKSKDNQKWRKIKDHQA